MNCLDKLNLVKFDIGYNILKKPTILTYLFIFPVVIFFLLSFIMSGSFSGEISSYDYFGLTIMIYFQLTMGTMVSNMIMEEDVKLPNMRIAYSLENESFIYKSKIIALILCDICSIIFYIEILKNIAHVNFGESEFIVFLCYLSLGIFSICLGTFLCILLKDESICNNLLGVIQLVLCALGGVFFPVSYMGKLGVTLSYFSIVRWINYAIGEYVYTNNIGVVLIVCVGSLLGAGMLLLLTRYKFKVQLFI